MTRFSLAATALFTAALVLALGQTLSAGRHTLASEPRAVPAEALIALPTLEMRYTEHAGLQISGTVPDDGEHAALLRRAKALYGAHRVSDRLQTGAVANPSWLSPSFLPDLRGTRQALARLVDGRLVIDGTVDSEAARQQVLQATADFAARGMPVEHRLVLKKS